MRESSRLGSSQVGSAHRAELDPFKVNYLYLSPPTASSMSSCSSDLVVLRLLCPVDRIGEVSRVLGSAAGAAAGGGGGGGGGGARIRFDSASASPFPSDRVVLVSCSSSSSSSSQMQMQMQAALLAVFERIAPPLPPHPHPSFHHQHQHQHQVVCRLLSPPSQVSCILGKGGHTLDRLRQDTAAQIRVFPREHAFPDFAPDAPHPLDLVTISGTFPAVKQALLSICALLLHSATALQQTTTKVLIPSHYLPFVTGPDATDLSHIKQISGATLTVEDPKPGEATGKVIIVGTPEQTKTAQSLVHGLIFCGVFNPS